MVREKKESVCVMVRLRPAEAQALRDRARAEGRTLADAARLAMGLPPIHAA